MTVTRYWRIEGFDGTNLIFESDIPHYLLSEKQIEELIRRLVSRHLTENEVVGASLNRKTKRTALLDIRHSTQSPLVISGGDNPHYAARVVDAE
ncbi:hypothetical protein [uncultured Tateyamaria sp.]|uniref:hypothetical protein n=1 Tax=uncultured Tateyamaria sp. TaxID=455651 RepID=UPI002606D2A7|nr:hypothetical protein [uncultured Tateyamaria sp.]